MSGPGTADERIPPIEEAVLDFERRITVLEREFRSMAQLAGAMIERLAAVEARPGAGLLRELTKVTDYEKRFQDFLGAASLELGRQNDRFLAATAIARVGGYPGSDKVGPIEDLSDDGYDGDLEEKPPGPNNP